MIGQDLLPNDRTDICISSSDAILREIKVNNEVYQRCMARSQATIEEARKTIKAVADLINVQAVTTK